MAFLDNNGLETLWGRIKTKFGAGFADLVKDSTSVTIKLQNGYGNDLDTVAIPLADSTNSKAGLMSPTEKSKLAGIDAGANAYTHPTYTANAAAAVKVGNDSTGHVVIGAALTASDVGAAETQHSHGVISSNGSIAPNSGVAISNGDRFVISRTGAKGVVKASTLSFDGSTTTQALTKKGTWATFVQDANYVHTDNNYTTANKTKVGYVDTGKSVSTYVSEQISSAMTGAAKYKGTVGTGGTVTALPTSGYKQGDYYVVCSAGTYAGESCEVGDMIFANKDYASGAVAADDWDIVQSNITAMTTEEINTICA